MIAKPRLSGLLVAALLSAAAVCSAADPFYLRLLRQGSDAYNRRDYATAARQLRVACFGLLDEPELLADGLVRLGLAQAAAGDPDGFRETFQRLAEVEDRFQGYSKAATPKEMRDTYEHFVVANLPEATLASSPSFSRLVPKPEQRLAQLSPKARRSELEKLIAAEPKEPKWRLMLGTLALDAGDGDVAREQADAALALSPSNQEALRLRGLALAREKKWAPASTDLKATGTAATDPRVAESLLRCLVQLEQWQDAAALVAQLPAAMRKEGAIPELAGRADDALAKARAAAAKPTTTPTFTAVVKPTATARPTATATSRPTATATPRPPATATPRATSTATPRPTATATPQPTPTATPRPTAAATLKPTATSPPTPTSAAPPTPMSLTSPPTSFVDDLARARELAAQDRLVEAFAAARGVADAHPESAEAQHLAGEIAYRSAKWADAVTYFRRGGDPGVDQPLRLFYLAVALYESGDRENSATTLKRCLGRIRNTDYVEQYRRKILGP